MAIPITIEALLEKNIVEWSRLEFKENWNPEPILKTISAFANDIDNWGGGYIIVGAAEENGMLKRPVTGLNPESIDHIQKELLKYCNYLKPRYIPVAEPVVYQGKHLLMIWVYGGDSRPYACPKTPNNRHSEKVYYIRKLSSTIEASGADLKELQALSNNVPFDDRINYNAELADLKFPLIQNHLSEIQSELSAQAANSNLAALASDLRIAGGPPELFKPLNVGLLFFNDMPEKFFPYTRIELVYIPDPTGQGMEEKVFSGPIQQQLRDALSYIRNHIITEKVFKVDGRAEADRYFNYSYEAIEELLSNAVYHKSYEIHEPITVRIERDCIEITSIPGPDRSISDRDLETFHMRSRRYRNRRIGDFLKELHLIEGRNTGIPKVIRALRANGSPMPIFLTDAERSYFTVILKIHDCFREDNQKAVTYDDLYSDEKATLSFSKKRLSRKEIRAYILSILATQEMSLNEIYQSRGYTGSVSKAYREVLLSLIQENLVEYPDDISRHSIDSKLRLKD